MHLLGGMSECVNCRFLDFDKISFAASAELPGMVAVFAGGILHQRRRRHGQP